MVLRKSKVGSYASCLDKRTDIGSANDKLAGRVTIVAIRSGRVLRIETKC